MPPHSNSLTPSKTGKGHLVLQSQNAIGGIRKLHNIDMTSGPGRAYQSYLTGPNSKTPKEVYNRNQGLANNHNSIIAESKEKLNYSFDNRHHSGSPNPQIVTSATAL